MILGSVYAEGHFKNSIFDDVDPISFYGPTYTSRLMRQSLLNFGVEINTFDINLNNDVAFEFYAEGQDLSDLNVPKYLFAQENPNINQLNCNLEYVKNFRKVFSWNLKISSQDNGVHLMIPYQFKSYQFLPYEKRCQFSCMINGNKRFKVAQENDLYEERFAVIEWYQKKSPQDFSLYGRGWEKPKAAYRASEKIIRRFKRLATQLFGYRPFSSYRGVVVDKGIPYSQTKFAYCYENTKDLTNYITEKIFDAMVYGCVPIYWGANNVTEYIPKECFIDRRDFSSQENLHAYLKSITPERYAEYQSAIFQFLNSNLIQPFLPETFVDKVVEEIVSDLRLIEMNYV